MCRVCPLVVKGDFSAVPRLPCYCLLSDSGCGSNVSFRFLLSDPDQLCAAAHRNENPQAWVPLSGHAAGQLLPVPVHRWRPLVWGKRIRLKARRRHIFPPALAGGTGRLCVSVAGGDPLHHGPHVRRFRVHAGVRRPGLGAFHLHPAGVLPGQSPQPALPALGRGHLRAQRWAPTLTTDGFRVSVTVWAVGGNGALNCAFSQSRFRLSDQQS